MSKLHLGADAAFPGRRDRPLGGGEILDGDAERAEQRQLAVVAAARRHARQHLTELGADVLLTQPGMSRLVARLEARGLVQRVPDPDDARASRIRLTAAGVATQRRIGLTHARHVAEAMTRNLDRPELEQLLDLCRRLA